MDRHRRNGVIVLLAAALAYGASLRNGFVWDDAVYVLDNAFASNPSNLAVLLDPRYYLRPQAVLGGTRPVFLASLMIDRLVWGDDPSGYHLTNVALHAANGLWVLLLGTLLAPGAALGAALLFVLHPVQSEAVNAISFRSDLLAAFFVFAGLWSFLRARASGRPGAWTAVSGIFFALGLLSKEMAAGLPLLALAAEGFFPEPAGRPRRLAAAFAAFGLAAVLYAGFWSARFRYQGLAGPAGAAVEASAGGPLTTQGPRPGEIFAPSAPAWAELDENGRVRAMTMTAALGDYLRLQLWPYPLAIDRAPRIVSSWADAWAWSRWLMLAAVAAAAFLWRRTIALAGFGAAWFLLSLTPVSGLVPLYNPVAERYLYLVTAGASFAAAGLWENFKAALGPGAARAASAGGVLILALYGSLSAARTLQWRDDASLFFSEAGETAQSPRVYYQRGLILKREGKHSLAASEFEAAVEQSPSFAEGWLSLGLAYGAAKDARAPGAAERAVALAPANPVFRFGHALLLTSAGLHGAAEGEYRKALELEPRYLEAWVNLGSLLKGQGRFKEAVDCYERAVLLEPRDALPFLILAAFLENSRGSRARLAELYRAALVREPGHSLASARLKELEKPSAPKRRR